MINHLHEYHGRSDGKNRIDVAELAFHHHPDGLKSESALDGAAESRKKHRDSDGKLQCEASDHEYADHKKESNGICCHVITPFYLPNRVVIVATHSAT